MRVREHPTAKADDVAGKAAHKAADKAPPAQDAVEDSPRP
jgi:hypothetical protein